MTSFNDADPPFAPDAPALTASEPGLAPLACCAAALQLLASASCRTMKVADTWLTFVVVVPMLAGIFVVLPHGVSLALVTAAVTIPALAGVARVLNRDQLLAR